MTNCTRCGGTGFLNVDQLPDGLADQGVDAVLAWIDERNDVLERVGGCWCAAAGRLAPCSWCLHQHDVTVCDCCGDGDAEWYGEPGQHYSANDPPGPNGPYAANGGLCRCH